jgi:hypothetical protein
VRTPQRGVPTIKTYHYYIFAQADVKLPSLIPDYINLIDFGFGHKKSPPVAGIN